MRLHLRPWFMAVPLLLAVQVVSPASSAAEDPAPRLSTPQLIERAVGRGRIGRATGDLFLAYALGQHRKLPARFRSDLPWDGTLPLLHLRERIARMPPGPRRAAIQSALDPVPCEDPPKEPDEVDSTYFHIHHDASAIGGGLDISDYAASLDAAWAKEVNDFGWAAPPLGDAPLYPVVVEDLGPGLYGFAMATTLVGNNAATSWDDIDAFASCIALNEDYSGFPSGPQDSLDATTAHEFNHSIQFGYGAITGPNSADDVFVEGGATWMEDEVFDGSNDSYYFLWPEFTDSMGAYSSNPYGYFAVFRALTERYGAGTAGAGEDVMQAFWEMVSQSLTTIDLNALNSALVAEGTTLADAYHAAAIALKFNLSCGGSLSYPHCLEEGPGYVAVAGPNGAHGSIGSPSGSFTGAVEDNYALNWVTLPSAGTYSVQLSNTSSGGQLRATVACQTATGLALSPLSPTAAGPGATISLASFSVPGSGCTQPPVTVITNQSQTAPNPPASAARSYTLSTGAGQPTPPPPGSKSVSLKAKPKKVDQGDKTRLTATVSACDAGDPVSFFRGSKKVGTKPTNAACVATRKVAVPRTSKFKAVSSADDDGGQGTSNRVKVRVRQP